MYLDDLGNVSRSCKLFMEVSKDSVFRARYLMFRWSLKSVFWYGYKKYPKILSVEVIETLVLYEAILSKYFVEVAYKDSKLLPVGSIDSIVVYGYKKYGEELCLVSTSDEDVVSDDDVCVDDSIDFETCFSSVVDIDRLRTILYKHYYLPLMNEYEVNTLYGWIWKLFLLKEYGMVTYLVNYSGFENGNDLLIKVAVYDANTTIDTLNTLLRYYNITQSTIVSILTDPNNILSSHSLSLLSTILPQPQFKSYAIMALKIIFKKSLLLHVADFLITHFKLSQDDVAGAFYSDGYYLKNGDNVPMYYTTPLF